MSSDPIISIFDTEQEVILHLCKLIEAISQKSFQKKRSFKIGLSGGSLISFLSRGLSSVNTDWSKWLLFFCDERIVPQNHPESTYGVYLTELLGKVPLQASQFVSAIENATAEEVASDYELKLKTHFPDCKWPEFDLLLLGMGPDGHTASLFPGHPILQEDNVWVAPITDSPKPPPARITLTLPVINNSKNCIFAVCGAGKANVIKQILKDSVQLPAGMVRPVNGQVHWILDRAAASQL